jgi:tRNA A-37 threonylcarbamoyl transferase component Bud32
VLPERRAGLMQIAALEPGAVIQETYEIVRRIGRGGMGEVYEAKHRRLAGRYAVKFLLEDIAGNDEAFARFRREAEVTSGIRHPNIVQVVDFNRTPEGLPYLVMEFLEGEELTDLIRRTAPLDPRTVQVLVEQIASALEAAHGRGIVHRDLKPQNLFLVRIEGRKNGLIKVMDFGISKVREATSRLTREHVVMGTPQYMAPEQAMGLVTEIDGRTDQFALAAIAYEMLAGHAAFRGDNLQSILFQVVQMDPPPLEAVVAGLDPEIGAVIARGLAKKREDRFPSVLELAAALARAVDGAALRSAMTGGTLALPGGAARMSGRSPSAVNIAGVGPRRTRWPLPLVAAAAAAAALGIGGWLATRATTGDDPTNAPAAGDEAERTPPLPEAEQRQPAAGAAARRKAPAPEPSAGDPAAEEAGGGTVSIELREQPPPGLQVTVDGVLTDLPVRLPRGPQLRVLRFDAPGFETYVVRVDGRQDRKIMLPMRRVETAGATASDKTPPPPRTPRARPQGARSAATVRGVPASAADNAAQPETGPTAAQPAKKLFTDF